MNKAKYSTDVTKFATIDMAKERYKLSRASVVNLAEENNALIHIGRCVRIDVQKLDKALDKLSEGSENYGADVG